MAKGGVEIQWSGSMVAAFYGLLSCICGKLPQMAIPQSRAAWFGDNRDHHGSDVAGF